MELNTSDLSLMSRLYTQARQAEELCTDERERKYWEGYCEALLTVSDMNKAIKVSH